MLFLGAHLFKFGFGCRQLFAQAINLGVILLFGRGRFLNLIGFDGAIKNREPREDWCMVDSTTPNMVRRMVSLTTILRAVFNPSHSIAAGENSIKRTVRYVATQIATSKRTDVVPCWTTRG